MEPWLKMLDFPSCKARFLHYQVKFPFQFQPKHCSSPTLECIPQW